MPKQNIERKLCEAASDYKLAQTDKEFASLNGGVETLHDRLLSATTEWEAWLSDDDNHDAA